MILLGKANHTGLDPDKGKDCIPGMGSTLVFIQLVLVIKATNRVQKKTSLFICYTASVQLKSCHIKWIQYSRTNPVF